MWQVNSKQQQKKNLRPNLLKKCKFEVGNDQKGHSESQLFYLRQWICSASLDKQKGEEGRQTRGQTVRLRRSTRKKESQTSQHLHICRPRGVSCWSLQRTSLLSEHTPERWLQPRQRCSCLLCRSPTPWASLTPPWITTPSWRRWSCWTLQGPPSSMPQHLKAQDLALGSPGSSLITLLEVSAKSLLIKLHACFIQRIACLCKKGICLNSSLLCLQVLSGFD